jgi:hypothetical protein
MNNEYQRYYDFQELTNAYDDFFYSDEGIYTCYLLDHELREYNLDFDYIKDLIQKLKNYEEKYGKLYEDEVKKLNDYKEILLDLNTGTNNIRNIYEKMKDIYLYIEDF